MKYREMIKKVQKDTQYWLIVGFGRALSLSKFQLEEKYKLIGKLLVEEYEEYLKALKNNDRLEQLNAISDLLFVANNIPFYEGKHNVDEWLITEQELQFYNPMYTFKHNFRNYELVINAINTIIANSGFSYYDIYKENEATFKSNMTKYCKTEEEAKLSVEMYANGTHPNMQNKENKIVSCQYAKTIDPTYKFIILSESAKIMKSHLFLDVEHFRA